MQVATETSTRETPLNSRSRFRRSPKGVGGIRSNKFSAENIGARGGRVNAQPVANRAIPGLSASTGRAAAKFNVAFTARNSAPPLQDFQKLLYNGKVRWKSPPVRAHFCLHRCANRERIENFQRHRASAQSGRRSRTPQRHRSLDFPRAGQSTHLLAAARSSPPHHHGENQRISPPRHVVASTNGPG